MKCHICKKDIVKKKDNLSTGYATTDKGKKICYACCALQDMEFMRIHGKITLYLEKSNVTNWPGTLIFNTIETRASQHNFGGTRTDVWFRFENNIWHGYQIGDRSQLCHCKRTKRTVTRT